MRAAQVEARLEELPVETPTVAAAARAVGCEESEIVKSVVFVCDGRAVLALVQGDRRAGPARVAAAAGARSVRTASPVEVLAATGFEAGGVAPFPPNRAVRAFLDEALLRRDAVWVGGGTPRHLARLGVVDLVRIAHAETAAVAD